MFTRRLLQARAQAGGHTIWVVTRLRHQDRSIGAPLQLSSICSLLERCERVEVVERRSARDTLKVAVLDDTEGHRYGTLTREIERPGGLLQAGSLVLQAAIWPI